MWHSDKVSTVGELKAVLVPGETFWRTPPFLRKVLRLSSSGPNGILKLEISRGCISVVAHISKKKDLQLQDHGYRIEIVAMATTSMGQDRFA